jgi:large subunit ribosomal protein L9
MEVILREHIDNLGRRGDAAEVEIARRVGENNTLYGSVTSADIAHALEAKGFQVDKRKIVLAEPIKAVGEVTVPLKIHRDVTVQLKVKVVRDTH